MNIDPQQREQRRWLGRACWAACLSGAMVFVIPLTMLLSLSLPYPQPDALDRLSQRPDLVGSAPARILLEGAKDWYRAMLMMGALVLALVAAVLLLLLRGVLVHLLWRWKHRKECAAARQYSLLVARDPVLVVEDPWNYNQKSGPSSTPGWWGEVMEKLARANDFLTTSRLHVTAAFLHALSAVPLLMMAGLMALMLVGDPEESVPQLYARAQADIAQMEAGQWETATVWLSPKVRPWHLDGPYAEGQPALLTRYGVIGKDTGHQWKQVYVPYGMDVSLDEKRLFNENYSVVWNAEHAQMYEVAYTSQFRFVLSLRPVETPEDFWE